VVPLLQRNLAASLRGELKFNAQDETQATFCRKISKEDGALDFAQSAAAIDARLRAFTPWPGAYFDHGETRIKVGQCSATGLVVAAPPGTVLAVGETVDVATAEGVLHLHELQRPGGRMLPVPDFLRGYVIEVGEVLPSVKGAPLLG
jgi:methionyl-tRNA formyltransferase